MGPQQQVRAWGVVHGRVPRASVPASTEIQTEVDVICGAEHVENMHKFGQVFAGTACGK